MKKLIILSVFALGFGMSLNAQSDGFFVYNNFEQEQNRQSQNEAWGIMPSMIGHGLTGDQDGDSVPLGSGLLLLGGMAVLYASRKRK